MPILGCHTSNMDDNNNIRPDKVATSLAYNNPKLHVFKSAPSGSILTHHPLRLTL